MHTVPWNNFIHNTLQALVLSYLKHSFAHTLLQHYLLQIRDQAFLLEC